MPLGNRTAPVSPPRWPFPSHHPTQILFIVGFKHQGQVLSIAADAPLGPLQAAAARLRRLADHKGHTGQAVAVKADGDDDGSGRPASPFYNAPGFKYQEQVRVKCRGVLA